MDPIGRNEPLEDRIEHSVWDEPGLSHTLSGAPPEGALTYRNWLDHRVSQTTVADTWKYVGLLAAISGPWSILGTMVTQQGGTGSFIVLLTIVGPLVEEVMKAAATLWAAEKRPYFFKSSAQILICMVVSGFCFAAIENILYLNVYIPNPTHGLAVWRWTVCVALHTGCAFISGVGIAKMWRQAMQTKTHPQLAIAAPYMMTAFVVHGIYNFSALMMEFGN